MMMIIKMKGSQEIEASFLVVLKRFSKKAPPEIFRSQTRFLQIDFLVLGRIFIFGV